MSFALTEKRRAKVIALTVALALIAPVCVPVAQAEAATYGFQFKMMTNSKYKSTAVTKAKAGSASARVMESKTNTLSLATHKAVLRVHRASDNQSVSESATFKNCTIKAMPYWSGHGKKGYKYKLWGQVGSSAGNKGTTVGGVWVP